MKYVLNASQTDITVLFTHRVKWSSCPADGHSTKTGSFTQNTLDPPAGRKLQALGKVNLLFHPTHTRLHGLHINGGAEDAGVENAGVDSKGGKCRSGKCRRDNRWKAVKKEKYKIPVA